MELFFKPQRTGIWVVETGCKYDNCGDIERYATYDNEDAARKHGAVIEEALSYDSLQDVRIYEVVVPAALYHDVPPLDVGGRVRPDPA